METHRKSTKKIKSDKIRCETLLLLRFRFPVLRFFSLLPPSLYFIVTYKNPSVYPELSSISEFLLFNLGFFFFTMIGRLATIAPRTVGRFATTTTPRLVSPVVSSVQQQPNIFRQRQTRGYHEKDKCIFLFLTSYYIVLTFVYC